MSEFVGFDLGKNSIGWVIVDTEKGEVKDMGCRVLQRFSRREKYKSGSITEEVNSKKRFF